jgi:hypothetical protein
MQLHQFLERHPTSVVGRPEIVRPHGLSTLALVAAVVIAVAALSRLAGDDVAIAVPLLALAALALAVAARGVPRARAAARSARAGVCCYAVSDDEILLVDPVGNAVIVDIDCVVELELSAGEPRLRTASDQGRVYAALFALFDHDDAPDPERFFDVVARRLRQVRPEARIIKRDAADRGLLLG